MKRSSTALRMMSLIAAAALVGCGGGGQDTAAAGSPAAAAPAPSPSPAPAPAPASTTPPVSTGNALQGKSLWTDLPNTTLSCDGCHGQAALNVNNVLRGATGWEVIASAIQTNKGGMGALAGKLTGQDMRDLSAYLATPNI